MPRKQPEGKTPSMAQAKRKKATKAVKPARASQKLTDGKKASKAKLSTKKAKPAPSAVLKTSEGLDSPSVTEKHAGGRPSDYREEYAEQARKLYQAGFTDLQVADWFGVCKATIYNWQVAHPEFLDSAIMGKDAPDDRMQRSLYHRGNGFEWIEEQAIKLREETWVNGNKEVSERVEVVKVRRVTPPDTQAAVFWMKNRRGWRDKTEVEHGVTNELAALLGQIDGDGFSLR